MRGDDFRRSRRLASGAHAAAGAVDGARPRRADRRRRSGGNPGVVGGENGYAELSIGSVATRAGVHRPAIYRRWPSKRHLVVDVVVAHIGTDPTPDTGDLRADLVAGITTLVVGGLSETVVGRILPALVADLAADPELARDFQSAFFQPRRDSTAAVLESARLRGDIRSDFDLDFVLDALASPIYYRALFRHLPLDALLAEQSVDSVLLTLTPPRKFLKPFRFSSIRLDQARHGCRCSALRWPLTRRHRVRSRRLRRCRACVQA